jgi:hypothetical protein
MIKYSFLFLFLILPRAVWAQDERFFRQIFSGELSESATKPQVQVEKSPYWFSAHTPYYLLDLNRDSLPESIVFAKKDNEDWLEIYNSTKEKIFSYQFENTGINSSLYRIEQKQLTKTTDVLMLYYYEGSTKFLNTDSTARLYLLTVDNRDLKAIHVYKGPAFFEERKSQRGHYHQRRYIIETLQLKNDDTRQIVFRNRGVNQVFFYEGKGIWKTFLR